MNLVAPELLIHMLSVYENFFWSYAILATGIFPLMKFSNLGMLANWDSRVLQKGSVADSLLKVGGL